MAEVAEIREKRDSLAQSLFQDNMRISAEALARLMELTGGEEGKDIHKKRESIRKGGVRDEESTIELGDIYGKEEPTKGDISEIKREEAEKIEEKKDKEATEIEGHLGKILEPRSHISHIEEEKAAETELARKEAEEVASSYIEPVGESTGKISPEIAAAKILEEARANYIKEYKAHNNSKKARIGHIRKFLGLPPKSREVEDVLPPSLLDARTDYEQAKMTYGEIMYKAKEKAMRKQGPPKGVGILDQYVENEIQKYGIELFENLVVLEREKLQEQQVSTWPPGDRSKFKRIIDWWVDPKNRGKRIVISSALMTGVFAFTPAGAALGLSGLILSGGERIARGFLGAAGGQVGGKAIEATYGQKIEKRREEAMKKLGENFTLASLINADTFYQEILKDYDKSQRRKIGAKVIAMAATGIGASAGFNLAYSHLYGGTGGALHELDTREGSGAPAEEHGRAAGILETPPKGAAPVEGVPAQELAKVAGSYIEQVHKGDSLWKLIDHQMDSHYHDQFSGLNEAQKTYIIDAIKDKIAASPKSFGIEDIDRIRVNQKIDFSKLFENQEDVRHILGTAKGLTPDQMLNIEHNNQLLAEWVKAHPGQRLTSGKIQEILTGRGVGPIPPAESVPPSGLNAGVSESEIAESLQPKQVPVNIRGGGLGEDITQYGKPSSISPEEIQRGALGEDVRQYTDSIPEKPKIVNYGLNEPTRPIVTGARYETNLLFSRGTENYLNQVIFDNPTRGISDQSISALAERINSGKLPFKEFANYYADKISGGRPNTISNKIIEELKANFELMKDTDITRRQNATHYLKTILEQIRQAK